MLSTKSVVEVSSKSKTLTPGLHKVKINNITLQPTPYDQTQYNVNLNVEGEDLGENFEGFLSDPANPSSPRYKGQIGRVGLSQYAYKDAVLKTGTEISRDQSILRALNGLAKALNKKDQLDTIEANSIEEFVEEADKVLSGPTYINMVIAGKAYENKQGYTAYNLFVAAAKDGKYGYEQDGVKDSKLVEFNPNVHIVGLKPKEVESFTPAAEKPFEL